MAEFSGTFVRTVAVFVLAMLVASLGLRASYLLRSGALPDLRVPPKMFSLATEVEAVA